MCLRSCRPPVPEEENKKLITVTWPVLVPPLCLELVLGTRVCAVRVDSAAVLQNTVRSVALLAGLLGLAGLNWDGLLGVGDRCCVYSLLDGFIA